MQQVIADDSILSMEARQREYRVRPAIESGYIDSSVHISAGEPAPHTPFLYANRSQA